MGYYDQQGLVKFSDFKRVSGRFNSEYKLFDDHFRIGENISLSHSWGTSVSNNAALGGTLYEAYKFQSITPVKIWKMSMPEMYSRIFRILWVNCIGTRIIKIRRAVW